MDTAAFRADLELIPRLLSDLAPLADGDDEGTRLLRSNRPERILVLGMGSSRYAAGRVARAARARGLVMWDELASTRLLPEPADDLIVIAVSATGESVEVLDAAQRFAGRGRLIAVTNAPGSSLGILADAVTPLHAGLEASGVACRTYRHTHVALERLVAAATAPGRPWGPILERAAAATATLLDTEESWAPALSNALLSPDGLHVLAAAEKLCSAQQSALMIRELPRRPAVACETGDWSHVDVYTTRTLDYRALIFVGSAWDDQAAEWMRRRSSRSVAIGGTFPGAELSLRFEGDDDDAVSVLVETLFLEITAQRWWSADPEYTFAGSAAPATNSD